MVGLQGAHRLYKSSIYLEYSCNNVMKYKLQRGDAIMWLCTVIKKNKSFIDIIIICYLMKPTFVITFILIFNIHKSVAIKWQQNFTGIRFSLQSSRMNFVSSQANKIGLLRNCSHTISKVSKSFWSDNVTQFIKCLIILLHKLKQRYLIKLPYFKSLD